MRSRTAVTGILAITALGSTALAHAAPYSDGHWGAVFEAAAEAGGDDVIKVYYRHGDSQTIHAGQGVTVGVGLHYQPSSAPLDFAATVGYKFVRTADYNTDLGIDRYVIKLTGTYLLPSNFWLAAGPVWHTGTKLRGDGYVPDIKFDDAVGGTVGFGWRWIGVSYTNIRYTSPETGGLDGSSGGITFAWKF
jgi:hypothetical protein